MAILLLLLLTVCERQKDKYNSVNFHVYLELSF